MKSAMASGCRTGTPSYKSWCAGTTTRRHSRLHPPVRDQELGLIWPSCQRPPPPSKKNKSFPRILNLQNKLVIKQIHKLVIKNKYGTVQSSFIIQNWTRPPLRGGGRLRGPPPPPPPPPPPLPPCPLPSLPPPPLPRVRTKIYVTFGNYFMRKTKQNISCQFYTQKYILFCAGIFKPSMDLGGQEPSRNMVVVPGSQATQPCGIAIN